MLVFVYEISRKEEFFFHPQTRLRGSDYIPSPSGHSENLFSYCIPLWVQVLQRCGISVPTSSSLNPDALLRCLFNPLSLMAKNSQVQDQFVYLPIFSFFFVLLTSGDFLSYWAKYAFDSYFWYFCLAFFSCILEGEFSWYLHAILSKMEIIFSIRKEKYNLLLEKLSSKNCKVLWFVHF